MRENKESDSTSTSKTRSIAYWITTIIIALETAVGAEWDLVRNPFVSEVITHLGYPLYILTIIGVWKIFGAVALVIPKFSRLKEWAYAGIFFIYSGAVFSAFATGDIEFIPGPLLFALITLASWYLRPQSRKVATHQNLQGGQEENPVRKKRKIIAYRTTLVILSYVLLSGGVGELFHLWGTLETASILGYPVYFLTLLGTWKILGGITIIVPRFPLLKEWAYAGIFFNMTGAAASHAIRGDYGSGGYHIIVPLFFAGITVASWALRPGSRKIMGQTSL